jgi:hypothetical protein
VTAAHLVRQEQAEVPRHLRTPIVPNDEHLHRPRNHSRTHDSEAAKKEFGRKKTRQHLWESEVVEERDQVADDVEDGVGGWVGGNRGVSVAAEVGGQRAEAAGGERGHLVAPGEPQLREAVDEEDRGSGGGAALGDVEGDAVDVRGPVPHLAGGFGLHALLLCSPG